MNNTTQNKLADMFAKRFVDYNTEVLKKLAEVIKQFDGLNYTEASKLATLLKYDVSYIDLVDELSKLTGKSKKEIKKILEETIKQHIEFADTFFKAKGMSTPVYKDDIYLRELVNSIAKVSEGDFVNIARSTGFAFLDKDNHLQFLDMKETYYKVIDECVYAISEGKDTFGKARRKIIDELVNSGVRRIVYANEGKKVYTERIDSAVRRNLLDSIREVSIESQKEFGKRFGADGIEVTVHENPAPDHQDVQGKQFKNEEFEKFQNDMRAESYDGEIFEPDYDGGDRRSIGQYNCYHTVFSIITGVSKPLYSKEELNEIKQRANEKINIDGKEYTRYEVTQLQRKIETQIRYEKDAQIMYKEVGDREEAEKHQLNITRLTRKYKEISKEAGIREQLGRASVSGYKPIKVKEVEKAKVSNIRTIDEWNKYFGEKYGSYDVIDGNVEYDETKSNWVSVDKNLSKIDPEYLDENLKQFEKLYDKYNMRDCGIRLTMDTKSRGRAIMKTYSTSEIQFTNLMKNKKDLLEKLEKGAKEGWHSKVNEENLGLHPITHEFGHIIENKIAGALNRIKRQEVDDTLKQEILDGVKLKENLPELVIFDKYVSGYGKSVRNYEWFAESFAQLELGEKNEWIKEFEKCIKKNLH